MRKAKTMGMRHVVLLLASVASMAGWGGDGIFSGLFRWHDAQKKAQAVIDDYVREVVEEAKGVRVIYTDGALDDDIRREAKRRGIELEPVPIMSRNGALALAMAMERGEDVALQLGFELWKQRRYYEYREPLPCSGVLARTGKMPEEDRQRGIEAAYRLGERILELYREDLVDAIPSERLKQELRIVQWHLARLATMRAFLADHARQTDQALKDKTFADELDNNNASLQNLRNELDQMEALSMRVVTPRRGLSMALYRADFTMARRYAELILKDDPDDPDANFAMGMSYHVQKQWSRAEVYFRRYLAKKEDAAVLNNLAIVYMETGRYDEALTHANRALELLPKSDAIKDTIAEIKKRKTKSAGLSFVEVTVYGRGAQMDVTVPPPWNAVKGEAIDGGVVFRLPVKTREEVDEIRRRLDAEPTLREKRGKPLTYDRVYFYDLVADDIANVKKTIGMFWAEGFLVRIEGERNGVLRVSTVSPAGLKGRLKEKFRVKDDKNGRLVLEPIREEKTVPVETGEPSPLALPKRDEAVPVVKEIDHPVANVPPVVVREGDPPAPVTTRAPLRRSTDKELLDDDVRRETR